MKKLTMCISLSCVLALSACTKTSGPSVGGGMKSAVKGVAHLVLSPFQIAAGLLEGIASVPYFMSYGIHDINKNMVDARANITLDDTYESAYGTRINNVNAYGDTGEVFRRMKHTTVKFQSILSQYGVKNPNQYILTSIDTANQYGYTLFAVVKREPETIKVIDKYNQRSTRVFSKSDRLYYEPFEKDVSGYSLDKVIDWSGLPSDYFKSQKGQAVLLTIAANSVINGKSASDYWDIEKRWINGAYREITEQKLARVNDKMQKKS